jgi:hypothetical protein
MHAIVTKFFVRTAKYGTYISSTNNSANLTNCVGALQGASNDEVTTINMYNAQLVRRAGTNMQFHLY